MSEYVGNPCLSGIVVKTTAEQLPAVADALSALPGVEVRQVDAATSRLIVVQEAPSVEREVEGMQRIQSVPGVVDASLVVHWFDTQ